MNGNISATLLYCSKSEIIEGLLKLREGRRLWSESEKSANCRCNTAYAPPSRCMCTCPPRAYAWSLKEFPNRPESLSSESCCAIFA